MDHVCTCNIKVENSAIFLPFLENFYFLRYFRKSGNFRNFHIPDVKIHLHELFTWKVKKVIVTVAPVTVNFIFSDVTLQQEEGDTTVILTEFRDSSITHPSYLINFSSETK